MFSSAIKLSLGRASRMSMTAQTPVCRMFSEKMSGTVKYFNSKKGFGFIIMADQEKEVFVHQTEIHKTGFRSLAANEDVEFELETDDYERMRAKNVTGPGGAEVVGEPFRPQNDNRNDYDNY